MTWMDVAGFMAEISLIGIALAGVTIVGIVGLIILPLFLLLLAGEGPAENPDSPPRIPRGGV